MTIKVQCACGTSLVYPDSYEGKRVPCRSCRAPVTVAGEKIQAPRSRSWRWWLPAIAVLIIPAGFLTLFLRSRTPRFTSASEEYRDGSKAPVDPKVDLPRIERLFAALAAASKEGNEEAFANCFHERRMLAEIELRGTIAAVPRRRDERSLEGELRSIFRHWCDQMKNSLAPWQSVQRCAVKFVDGRGEAEAAVAMKCADRLSRFRFWLIKENDAWAIFDYESLELGFRMSTRPRVPSEKLDKAENLMVRGTLDEALEILGFLDDRNPDVGLVHAEVLYRLKRLEEALSTIDRVLEVAKGIPRGHQLRGFILHGLGRTEDGIRSQEEFMKAVGDDAEAWLWVGKGYEALGKRDRALEAYRKGAACDETETANRAKLKELEGK